MSDLILYTSEDGQTRLHFRVEGKTVWLTQLEIAELFQTTTQNVTTHIGSIYEDEELDEAATCKELLQVRSEGSRQVQRSIKHYSLDIILAIGYRVRSPRGTQFRQWATTHLREFIVKGFVMDDERLKNPGGWDYFDELLARIREIRASEKRFYQKIRDLFALSSDYKVREKDTKLFFAEVQNKLLYAATRHTAAELIVQRADPAQPNMALTTWSGSRVRKQDVIIAKNYLTQDEIDTLNRLVVIFLEQAELRVKQKKDLTLDYWRDSVDKMLTSNEQPLLGGPGSVSREDMKRVAHARYDAFDTNRRAAEALAADAEDLKEIEELEEKLKKEQALTQVVQVVAGVGTPTPVYHGSPPGSEYRPRPRLPRLERNNNELIGDLIIAYGGEPMSFDSIIWDLDDDPNGSVQHCARHGFTKEEVEEVLQNPTDTDNSHSSGNPVAFGDTSTGRHLLVVYEEIDADTVYPITAYDVPRRNRP